MLQFMQVSSPCLSLIVCRKSGGDRSSRRTITIVAFPVIMIDLIGSSFSSQFSHSPHHSMIHENCDRLIAWSNDCILIMALDRRRRRRYGLRTVIPVVSNHRFISFQQEPTIVSTTSYIFIVTHSRGVKKCWFLLWSRDDDQLDNHALING